jgi:hypothetical protein
MPCVFYSGHNERYSEHIMKLTSQYEICQKALYFENIIYLYLLLRGYIMGILTKIVKAVEVLTEDESVEKGNDFEKYVVGLFDKKYCNYSGRAFERLQFFLVSRKTCI